MNWLGMGGAIWAIRLREIEWAMRGMFRTSREEPEEDLPLVDLPETEQRDAVRREAARRLLAERE